METTNVLLSSSKHYYADEVKSVFEELLKNNWNDMFYMSDLLFDIDDNGDLKIQFPDDNVYPLTENAQKDICKKVGIPHGFFKKIPDDLKLRNLRTLAAEKRKMFKFLFNGETLRGVVNKNQEDDINYKNLMEWVNNLDSEENSFEIVPYMDYTEEDLLYNKEIYFNFLFQDIELGTEEDEFYLSLNVSFSDLEGYFSVYPTVFNNKWKNGLILSNLESKDFYKVKSNKLKTELIHCFVELNTIIVLYTINNLK